MKARYSFPIRFTNSLMGVTKGADKLGRKPSITGCTLKFRLILFLLLILSLNHKFITFLIDVNKELSIAYF